MGNSSVSRHNTNIVVKLTYSHCEKIKGVILTQVCYAHLSITNRLERTFSFADALMTAS